MHANICKTSKSNSKSDKRDKILSHRFFYSNIIEWVARFSIISTIKIKGIELVLDCSLETVLEHRDVLYPLEIAGHIICVDEESSKNHEGNDENRHKSHSDFHFGDED